jgi:F-type H+-transporting ATPase subunit b
MLISSAIAATAKAPGEAAKGVFPPFDTSTFSSQLFWLLITFGVMMWLMSKLALPRVGEILEQRKARIEGDLAQASKAQADANAASAAYDKTLADAKAGAQASAKAMNDTITAEAEAKRTALEADLSSKLVAAEKRIAATKANAMSNVSAIAEDITGNIVQHLTGKAPDAAAIKIAVAAAKRRQFFRRRRLCPVCPAAVLSGCAYLDRQGAGRPR